MIICLFSISCNAKLQQQLNLLWKTNCWISGFMTCTQSLTILFLQTFNFLFQDVPQSHSIKCHKSPMEINIKTTTLKPTISDSVLKISHHFNSIIAVHLQSELSIWCWVRDERSAMSHMIREQRSVYLLTQHLHLSQRGCMPTHNHKNHKLEEVIFNYTDYRFIETTDMSQAYQTHFLLQAFIVYSFYKHLCISVFFVLFMF